MPIVCPTCGARVNFGEEHPHKLGIEVIPDNDPRTQDSPVPPLHERARRMWAEKKE